MSETPDIVERLKNTFTRWNNPPSEGLPDGAHVLLDAAGEIASRDAEITRLRAALEAERWQPIETAPTHNRILLWWRTCKEPRIGRWEIDEDFASRPRHWVSPEEGWRSCGDQCIPRNQKDCTHWRPLPSPPEAQ